MVLFHIPFADWAFCAELWDVIYVNLQRWNVQSSGKFETRKSVCLLSSEYD